MALILERRHFTIETPDKPHIDRNDGGHIIIRPKAPVRDRQELTPKLAIKLMRLTVITGIAMSKIMNGAGVARKISAIITLGRIHIYVVKMKENISC